MIPNAAYWVNKKTFKNYLEATSAIPETHERVSSSSSGIIKDTSETGGFVLLSGVNATLSLGIQARRQPRTQLNLKSQGFSLSHAGTDSSVQMESRISTKAKGTFGLNTVTLKVLTAATGTVMSM